MQTDTKSELLKAGRKIAISPGNNGAMTGYTGVTAKQVSDQTKTAITLMFYYWKTIDSFHTDLLRDAIMNKDLRVIAQGIVIKHPLCELLTDDFKKTALLSVL